MNYELGPEIFRLLNAKEEVGNQTPVVYGKGGLSLTEIAKIQNELGFKLPDDFVYLLQNIKDEAAVLFPWSKFDKKQYDGQIAWVLKGIEFDVENNNLWIPRWGERPTDLSAALEIARNDFPSWPKLLPIYGHRFLAAEPCQAGNPVFSIMQSDIIYYAANLAHYLLNEFVDHDWDFHTNNQTIKRIDIWSDFAEQLI
jgi:hypothetical protein